MVKAVIIFLMIGYLIGCIHGSKVAQFLSGVDLKSWPRKCGCLECYSFPWLEIWRFSSPH